MCEIYSKFTLRTPTRRQRLRSSVFIASFEHISLIFQVSIVDFEQVNVS